MRQLIVQVPRGYGGEVLASAEAYGARNLACLQATAPDGACDLVLAHVPNAQVETLIGDLQRVPELRITLEPRGVITLYPPASDTPHQVVDVGIRAPIEVFLGGLQSVGSWTGFLGYAVAAAIVVWIGLFTNTVFLLTAAMLIAPFAGPAMTAALATARGDVTLLGRSLLRYFAGLGISIAVAWVLSLAMRQEISTQQMLEQSFVPSVAVLLPLVAGAAGALNLCQSERSSLVSGAATGMLVAASLAPPAGLIGMAAALGEWDMAKSGAFVLVLQLGGINLSGAAVFRLLGQSPKGVRYERGRTDVGLLASCSSAIAVVALVGWQLWTSPDLQRSTQAQRAAAEVKHAVEASGLALPVEVNVRFTRADIPGQNTLLVEAFVVASAPQPRDHIKQQISSQIRTRLNGRFNVQPLIDVTVLEP